ncbi:hypothetical protein ELI02_33120 [Rhizobium leguminosarum]|nr:hypothetical protein EHH54_37205 [Rhizobium leguminosarum]TAW06136.1 hypothetical protein ELI25_31645 [Rhizobium ruizarguesonis]TAU83902.1 hypothetical protein ELI40_11825 [Rhizobium leguminosarum]TAU89076.1 hypothetical protein ELI41_11225 [Rhizobium leguminosarum]TAV41043.1 hypothetical protein ELI31_34070 [Rhizobium leguminosarum]
MSLAISDLSLRLCLNNPALSKNTDSRPQSRSPATAQREARGTQLCTTCEDTIVTGSCGIAVPRLQLECFCVSVGLSTRRARPIVRCVTCGFRAGGLRQFVGFAPRVAACAWQGCNTACEIFNRKRFR